MNRHATARRESQRVALAAATKAAGGGSITTDERKAAVAFLVALAAVMDYPPHTDIYDHVANILETEALKCVPITA
jgi:hypothetical protein